MEELQGRLMFMFNVMSKFLKILKKRVMMWYNLTALEYALKDEENPQANLDIKIMVKRLTSFKTRKYVLDLGCGAGRYFSFIEGENIVGVDFSIEMLKQAKKHVKKTKINLIRADMYYLPFRRTFDFILSMSVIGEYCPLSLELLKEICSVLRSKGTFLFTVIPLHHLLLPYKRYLMFFLPLQIFNILRGKSGIFYFGVSKVEIRNKLKKTSFKFWSIKERHGLLYPHYIVAAVYYPRRKNENR